MTKWDDTRYCLVWVFKLFNISIKLYHPSFFWDLRIKTQILQRVSFFIQDCSILLSFFLNIIILKCSPFFKRSKDKKNQKTLGRQSDNFCLPKLHVLCYWLLWTGLSTFFYAHLPSKHLISRHKILKLCTFSQHGDIQLSPPHKIHWSQDDCIKEKRDLLH